MFIAVLFTIYKIWKWPKCPSVDEWIKTTMVHVHKGTVPSGKKKEILPSVTARMDLQSLLSEISQSEKDKYHIISLICGI